MDEEQLNEEILVAFGGSVKMLDDGRLGGYLVRFTSPEEPDLEGDYFDAETDFGIEAGAKTAIWFNHRLPLSTKDGKHITVKQRIGEGTLTPDENGILVEAVLYQREQYEKLLDKLGWSSGTVPHLVDAELVGKAHHITHWPLGLDASLTPTPAEPRNVVMPLKAWAKAAEIAGPEPETEPDEGSVGAVTIKAETVHVTIEKEPSPEEVKMENKEGTAPQIEAVDVEAIASAAASVAAAEAVDQYRKALEAEKPKSQGGFVTGVADESDRALEGNPYTRLGDFLMEVKAAGTGGQIASRLMPLKDDLEGFNLTKALGNPFVGSMYSAATKGLKQTGLNEGANPAGGFLVDTDRRDGLMERVYSIGDLIQRVAMFQVSSNSNGMTFRMENETSRATGSRRGGVRGYWLAEAGVKTASQPEFREVEMRLHKCAALVYATDELLQDAGALESYIMRVFPEELRFIVEDSIVNGTGVGMPLGILPGPCLVTVGAEVGQAATSFVAENAINMWARLWSPSKRNAVWLINPDVSPQLHQMNMAVGVGGQLVYLPAGGLSAAPYGTLMGRPVLENEYCPTLGTLGDVILADLSQYYMIEKGGIQSASSIHVNFVYDETVFRFVYRVDGLPSWNSALTPFQGTNTVSPFVVLEARP